MMRTTTLACCLVAVLGCSNPARRGGAGGSGGNGGGGGGGTIDDLVVTPADAMIDVDATTLPTIDYQVHDQSGTDVTSDCTLAVEDSSLGSFSGATFHPTGTAGGVTHVRATRGSDGGKTSLTVRISKVVIAPGAPAGAPGVFGGPATGAAPTLVYPPDGTLIPPNLNELDVQFTPPAGTTLFEIGFVGPALDLKIYTPCVAVGGGCSLVPDDDTWKLLSHASASTTVAVTLRSTDGNGGPVGSAAAQKLSFGDSDLQGGLYYWAAASGSILRYDFGLRNQTAEKFYTAAQSGSTCVGCHVLSRNGARIAVGMNIPGPAELRTLDVATRATLFDSGGAGGGIPGGGIPGGAGSNFEALSPDGTQALINSGANLALIDTGNGMSLAAGAIMNATMPDWSADGKTVVFVRDSSSSCPLGLCGSQPGVSMGTLMLTSVSGTSFSGETTLVAGGGDNYYPSLSPDGAWVAFNRSTMTSYDAPDAAVWVVPTTGGGAPVNLTAANVVAGNSWPKFAPFAQTFQGKPIFWLTFSSRRDYGLRLQQTGKTQDMQIAQIWMVAVSPDRVAAGDGGYPAFWLPFQDITTGNHIAQWTEKVERAPCTPIDLSQCMPDETCMNNVCVPNPIQ
jgi:WD40 repeat protein